MRLASTGLPEPFRAPAGYYCSNCGNRLASTGLPEPFRGLLVSRFITAASLVSLLRGSRSRSESLEVEGGDLKLAQSRFYGAPGAVPRASRMRSSMLVPRSLASTGLPEPFRARMR